ncbi:hypothetical protein OG828_47580 [Streptomyces sp. NBC_00457]|uniref:hypothetical protein n=1 Tax=Streptomyces sp. NBC_00457 TaxID=2975748 RepID=UPI002E1DE9F3
MLDQRHQRPVCTDIKKVLIEFDYGRDEGSPGDPNPAPEDPAPDDPAPGGPLGNVMIVGDSISNGYEGDHTWRYRLWEWVQGQKVPATFVGPLTDTMKPDDPVHPSLLSWRTA